MKYFTLFLLVFYSSFSYAREQIRIVGSSTLYPFITVSSERFGKVSGGRTPVVEATGTGGGFHLFCSGNSMRYPDMVNASRKMKDSERLLCKKNGISNITELVLGYDGIILAVALGGKINNLTKKELFLALAKKIPSEKGFIMNPYTSWMQINERLPNTKIEIYGPSFNSGTRETIIELVMNEFCNSHECKEIREDDHYIDMPENDNVIVHKLAYNKKAIGIISYSLLKENSNIKGIKIDGFLPTKTNIVNEQYPLSRALFVYVNNDHIKNLPEIEDFIQEITSENTIGSNGYLTKKGLITKSK